MYSQPWSPTPSTTAEAPLLRTAKRSPAMPAEVRLAAGGAVEHRVADQDRLLGHEGRPARSGRPRSARRRGPCPRSRSPRPPASSDIPAAAKAPKLCPAEPVKWRRMVSSGSPALPVAARHLPGEHRPHGAVGARDGRSRPHRARPSPAPARRCGSAGGRATRSSPWSCASTLPQRHRRPAPPGGGGCGERSSVRPFQWSFARARSRSERPIISSIGAEAELRHPLADLLGDEEEVVDHVLRLPAELRAEHRVLRGDPHGAGVQVALPHHDAPLRRPAARWRSRTPRRPAARRSPRRDRCASGRRVCSLTRPRRSLSTSVCCVSASPISQGIPARLMEESGEAPVPPAVARDHDQVRVRLRDARGHRAHARLAPPASPRSAPAGSPSSGRG